VTVNRDEARIILRARDLAELRIGNGRIRCPEHLTVEEVSSISAQFKRNPFLDCD
jgi:hypothetical protein